ncbi:hypothetical protein [Anaerocolumna xylanovorans]|uniref:Uncharacterized protein n=1 Tax=Anaerocolumna xylanovorans DSM 12503 TaxID=1121345 RepID=A0A1M7XYG9_9FIRM|nr:hypothetical protein [Anaerocolumna xylanovorans]SHO44027.1 hypothetical protein SAMN02745217_00440 [Anaerocolumna xylanovorans DSM 12503]
MKRPILTKANNRTIPAQYHPYSGSPENWLSSGISFDFFINWKTYAVQNEIWVKRLLDKDEMPPKLNIYNYLKDNDGDFLDLYNFASGHGFDLHYMLFDDTQNWGDDDSILFDLHCANGNWINERVDLTNIKSRICELSGGKMRIGEKGLFLSTSNLETTLSKTDYPWPGDVDAIVLHKDNKVPLVMLEYRKHTRESDFESVSNYYINKADKRKYDRLQLLKNAINPQLSLIVVTYPTSVNIHKVLLESIKVEGGKMLIEDSITCQLPNGINQSMEYKKAIYYIIKK